ncbi:MAG: hypothetical protein JSW50_03305 [Candidatus Latescibacterota bacterium]|nr:MAG: hypothetical protein JSW50_03305 [Candidatus Latescibacterota bacterium]
MKQILLQLVVIAIVLSSGCSEDDNGVNPNDRLCGGQSGLAARITGTPEPLEMCVSNQDTRVDYTPPGGSVSAGLYETTSTYTSGDLTIEISTLFYAHATPPQTLNVTGNRAEAEFDPDGFWVYYREIKDGGYDVTSTTVTGTATLTYNDQTVAVVTFSNLEIMLVDTATQSTAAGERRIPEGYLNVTVD